jgi:hypothetical protein
MRHEFLFRYDHRVAGRVNDEARVERRFVVLLASD